MATAKSFFGGKFSGQLTYDSPRKRPKCTYENLYEGKLTSTEQEYQ